MQNHKISEDIKKWELDRSKYSKDDLEVIDLVQFPPSLGYRDTAQKRIKRMYVNGGYADKQAIDINDLKYTIVGKSTANKMIAMHAVTGNTPKEVETNRKFMEGVLKSKAQKHVYIDANFIEEELEWLLRTYSSPKPTPSMIVLEVKEEKETITKDKPKGRVKAELTDEQMATAKEKYSTGELDLKEIATLLDVPQITVKTYLQTLK